MRMPGSRAMVHQATTPAAPTDALSRRLSTSLRSFNVHARACSACIDPYAVHKSPSRQLCDVGHQLATEIAVNLYDKARSTSGGVIEVSFPEGWESVDGLIRAITHKLQGAPSNYVDVNVYDALRTRERVQYIPAAIPTSPAPVNRGSAYARDVSHRSGSGRRASMDPRRTSSFSLVEATPVTSSRRSPSPRRVEGAEQQLSSSPRGVEGAEQQLSSSPRSSGRSVAFNPQVQTRYF
ncbi:uncharacterized protein LAJ45_01786 [Morchella importuna]|uniref:Uncharacterized protein n=1 Tax=Morchella conica CCBAS932 TaxID=1392247 RepID=A0A3N4L1P7_9PEZI|nr:uncharacterized protein LAJ45_01786 [Morchella importuna]KAH8154019.1 hypothetical protein LAJ45_01786 [Morchella importuna]RPB16746.1 hypothetical protein P167DRAFT_531699 [Morchella conica CCBAS932]